MLHVQYSLQFASIFLYIFSIQTEVVMDGASPFIIVRGDGRKDHELDVARRGFDTLETPSLKKTVALPEYLDIVITCISLIIIFLQKN